VKLSDKNKLLRKGWVTTLFVILDNMIKIIFRILILSNIMDYIYITYKKNLRWN